jgi:hypothetical protein
LVYNDLKQQEVVMDWKDHMHQVGGIVTNPQALETVLRYFLLRLNGQKLEFPKPGDADAAENMLTSYEFLGELADSYNNALKDTEKQFAVNREVVTIRDAFAHGRLLTNTSAQDPPYRLWKFGRAKNGRVPIEFSQELTLEWLTAKTNMIEKEKQKVVNCFKGRGYQGLG